MVRPVPKPAAAGEVGVLPVQGNVYLLNLGDVNIVAQVGDDGILLVDSGPGGVERSHHADAARPLRRPAVAVSDQHERESEPYRGQRRA